MKRALGLLALLPALAFGQQAVKLYATDTVQSSCTLAAANDACQVAMVGKTSVGFVVTGNTTPTGMFMVAEQSRDGTNWAPVPFVDDTDGDCAWTVTNAQLATTGFQRSLSIGNGVRYVRVRLTARTTNATTVAVTATDTQSARACLQPDAGHTTNTISTATTLAALISNPMSGCTASGVPYSFCTGSGTGTASIYITSIIASSSVASATAADAQFTLKYGTGIACGTGTTTLMPLAMNVVSGGFVWTLPPGSYIKVPAGKDVCWIHAVVGSKIINATYFIAQ